MIANLHSDVVSEVHAFAALCPALQHQYEEQLTSTLRERFGSNYFVTAADCCEIVVF